MYHSLEEKKLEQATGFWKCDECGKRFFTEHHVYKHMYRKHEELINMVRNIRICRVTAPT